MSNDFLQIMHELRICVVIPTYNNSRSLKEVIDSVLSVTDHLIVVDDGSTDTSVIILNELGSRITAIKYYPNRGKGYALKMAFREAIQQGFDYAITMDSDGQHQAADIENFVTAIEKHPHSLLVGSRGMKHENMPQKNTFANRFSNFWFALQTAHFLPDTQSGFRVYPLKKMGNMNFLTNRYETELEILVRCAWRNIKILPVPINVYYPPLSERVSHFRPGADFFRISLLNTILCLIAIFYGYPSMIFRKLFKINS